MTRSHRDAGAGRSSFAAGAFPLLLAVLLAAVTPPLAAAPGTPGAPGTLSYLVFGPTERLHPLPPGVEIVGPSGDGTLVAGPASAVEELAMRGMSLVRLSAARPAAPARRVAPPLPAHLEDYDPAVAAIVSRMSTPEITATIQRLQDFRTRHTPTDSCRAAGYYLRDRFQQLGYPVTMDFFTVNGFPAYNVIAEKAGTVRPDEIYIICGHYDSISGQAATSAPGADDNASGTSAVVEAARVLAGIDCEATIRFIAWSGEEQGLIGSEHYVTNTVIPYNHDVRAVLNLDMIGYVSPAYPEWDANWYADQTVSFALGQFVGDCVETYTTCTLHLIPTSGPQYGSDHYFFAENGYPAVFDIDAQLWGAPDWNPYYHSPQDLIGTLTLEYVTEMARGAVAALAELAGAEGGTTLVDPGDVTPLPLAALAVGPNPFQDQVAFAAGERDLRLEVVDATGRRVAALAGRGPLVWRGEDARGRPVAPGIYFYTVRDAATADGARATGRVVLVR
jgi:hypothetical protein